MLAVPWGLLPGHALLGPQLPRFLIAQKGVPQRMSGFVNKGGFRIDKEPFSEWAKSLNRAADHADERLSAGIERVFDNATEALREAIRGNSAWPDEIADNTSFDKIGGEFQVDFEDPQVVGLEYGDADGSSPAPVLRTFADAHSRDADADLTDVVRQATGL